MPKPNQWNSFNASPAGAFPTTITTKTCKGRFCGFFRDGIVTGQLEIGMRARPGFVHWAADRQGDDQGEQDR
jgi:hypothetical protein